MSDATPILIVEDEIVIAMDLEYELEEQGFAPVCAGSVQEAKQVLAKNIPSIAVLDIQLRSETSFELAEQLADQGVPFLFLSGNDRSAVPDHLKQYQILTKPVRMAELLSTIRAMLPKQ